MKWIVNSKYAQLTSIFFGSTKTRKLISNIIKGKIQHDKTFAAAAATATAINFKKINLNLIRAGLG